MKAKYLWLFAAMLAITLVGCKQETPFDTQSPDDAPLILRPYNESGTGSFTYNLANPDTPLLDSVTVTPSRYTTVNWYLDNVLVFTGLKIEMYFPAGTYALTIEAVTQAGKSTKRTGTVNVNPYDTDPFSAAPAAGRHFVPKAEMSITGSNLSKVAAVRLTRDFYGQDLVCSVEPTYKEDAYLTFILPETADGKYYLRLMDADNKMYGAGDINVHNAAVALDGYSSFVPKDTWVITGVNLQDVASVKVDDVTITDLTADATSVTLTAPDMAVGEHKLSMSNKDGSSVIFITAEGTVTEVTTIVSAETTLWEGPVALDWNADLVNITAAAMAEVPLGSTILVYFEIPEAEYHNLRITTPWWGDDLVAQFDVTGDTPNPFTFIYDERCKGIVDQVGSWSIVGFGETINKITYK